MRTICPTCGKSFQRKTLLAPYQCDICKEKERKPALITSQESPEAPITETAPKAASSEAVGTVAAQGKAISEETAEFVLLQTEVPSILGDEAVATFKNSPLNRHFNIPFYEMTAFFPVGVVKGLAYEIKEAQFNRIHILGLWTNEDRGEYLNTLDMLDFVWMCMNRYDIVSIWMNGWIVRHLKRLNFAPDTYSDGRIDKVGYTWKADLS